MSDLVEWLNKWEARPRYNRALSLLETAHQACFKSPDRDVLGMSQGPFSDVNEVLGMFAVIEQDFKCAAARITKLEAENARLRTHREKLERTLTWCGENARLARLITSDGDLGRHNLAHDGGTRARAALAGKGDGE